MRIERRNFGVENQTFLFSTSDVMEIHQEMYPILISFVRTFLMMDSRLSRLRLKLVWVEILKLIVLRLFEAVDIDHVEYVNPRIYAT